MKIICTSDWHLGNLFHCNDRLPEHEHFLQWLLGQIEEHRPDALLVAGDVFDNGNPSAKAQSAYYKFLAEATQRHHDMTIVITAGNHDSASRLEAPRELLTHHHVEVRGTIKRYWVTNADGQGDWQFDYDDLLIQLEGRQGDRAVVLAVPYLRSEMLRDANYSQGVNNFLRSLTGRARELHRDVPLVMMAHMYATGADIACHDASETFAIGGLDQVDMKGWTDHPDYLTCGHIHKRQHIWNTDWARYSGSVLPMSFAEKDYTHGVDLVTLSPNHAPQVEQLVYTPQHRLVVLPEDDNPLTAAKLKKLINTTLTDRLDGKIAPNAPYVMLRVAQEKLNNDEIHELDELVGLKNAILCRTQKFRPQLDATHAEQPVLRSVDDLLNSDPMLMLRQSFEVQKGHPLNERQLTMLNELIQNIKHETND